mgnify:CR=1 FL=1
MYFAKDFKIKAAHKFEFGCGFYFCVIGVLKYIIGNFLITIEDKYGFKLKNCNWMTTENLDIYCYQNGEEVELNLL